MTALRTTLLAAAVLFAAQAPAHADEWEVLGRRNVNFVGDRDTIPVGHKGTFKKIKIKVTGNAINILDLKVHFGNGSVQDVAVRQNIPKGGETRVIDLPGAARVITKIVMVYKTKMVRIRKRGQAQVVVFGKQASGVTPATPDKPATPNKPKPVAKAQEWVLLGSRDVKFSAEKDTIPVTAVAGDFRKLKLKVLQNAVHMIDLKVHFGNGEVHDVALKSTIAAGGETRVIDLPGTVRHIKKLVLRYRSKLGLKALTNGHARVKVFGLRVAGSEGAGPAPVAKPVTPKPAAPASGEWQRLGETQVKWRAERDVIQVSASEGRFTKLKFKVRGAPIELLDMKVFFGNGDVQDVSLRFKLAAGGESRVIDLAGNTRVIKRVQFVYRKSGVMGRLKRASLALWGRH